MIDELLVSFLKSDAAIDAMADEIAVGEVPIDADGRLVVETYIWISMFDEADELDLDGESGLTRYRFDIECCSTTSATAKRLARLVKRKLQGHAGAFGSVVVEEVEVPGIVEAVYVESKDDDYVPVNQFTDSDLTVIAMDVEIVADDAQDDN